MSIKAKIAGGITTGVFLAGIVLPAGAFAQTCTISSNGVLSHNKCKIVTVNKTSTKQVNVADVDNHVSVHTSSGGNTANGNVGGDVTVTSGDSSVTVTITNILNANVLVPAPTL